MARVPVYASASSVELPVTPLLDMTFQLLAFLIFTFRPQALQEGKVEFTLPAATRGCNAYRGDDVPDEEGLPLTVVVKTVWDGVNDGNISLLLVQAREGEVTVHDVAGLQRYLATRRRAATGQEQVKIAAEARLKYTCVIAVVDACLQAGFPQVGFAAPPDLQ